MFNTDTKIRNLKLKCHGECFCIKLQILSTRWTLKCALWALLPDAELDLQGMMTYSGKYFHMAVNNVYVCHDFRTFNYWCITCYRHLMQDWRTFRVPVITETRSSHSVLRKPALCQVWNGEIQADHKPGQHNSKLLEKPALSVFRPHDMSTGNFSEFQWAYRTGYSSKTALQKLRNDVVMSTTNDRKQNVAVSAEKSRAVCHGALCSLNCCSSCTCHQSETSPQRTPTVCVIAEAALASSLILTHSVRMYLSICLSIYVSPHNILFPDLEAKRLGRFRWNLAGKTARALAVFLRNCPSLPLLPSNKQKPSKWVSHYTTDAN